MIISKILIGIISVVVMSLLFLCSCGSPSPATGGGGTGGTKILIGGSIQGTPLNLMGLVSSYTGIASTAMMIGVPDGASTGAGFAMPMDITTDGVNLYITDSSSNKIRKIVIATGVVSSLTGTTSTIMPSGATDGMSTTATFNQPEGITTDGNNLYIADTLNNKIRKIEITTGIVSSVTGAPNASMAAGAVDGASTTATFNAPTGITTDGINLYITDAANNKIRKIVIATGVVSTLAGTGSPGAANGASTTATFQWPRRIITDGTNLYIAEQSFGLIRKIVIATGDVSTLAGGFIAPYGITTDGTNLYIADSSAHKIMKIVVATGVVSSLTGIASTTMTPGAADGAGTIARFFFPSGITTDGIYLYIADTSNNKIRKIQ